MAFASLDNLQEEDQEEDHEKKILELVKKVFNQGDYKEAFRLVLPLLNSDDLQIQMEANLLVGKIYVADNSFKKSLFYFKTSLKILDTHYKSLDGGSISKVNLEVIEAENLIHLGKINDSDPDEDPYLTVDSTYYYLNRLIQINTLNREISLLKAKAYNNLSILEFNKENFLESKKYIDNSINLFVQLDREKELPTAYLNLANIYDVTNQKAKALEIYFKALSLVENENDQKTMGFKENLYFNIAWTLYNLKDYTAYEYLEKSYDLKDTLLNMNLKKELKKIEQIHNIDLVKREEINKRQRLKNNIWVLLAVVALALVSLIYFVTVSKLKERNLQLKISENQLEQKNKLDKLRIESQEKIINAALDAKEDERKEIAEILHDNVSAMLSSANMHLSATKKQFDKTPTEILKTERIITEASQKIRDLSHVLMSSILLKFGLKHAVKDISEKYSNSEIRIFTEIDEMERYPQAFEIKVFNIIQELLNNILKHSKATFAYINIEEKDGVLHFMVKDNGVGGVNVQNSETDGVGLTQIKARIKIMLGEINIKSNENQGTEIRVALPIPQQKLASTT